MVTILPVFIRYVFVKNRSPPKAEFVLRLHYLSSTDTEMLNEIKPVMFVFLFFQVFYVYTTQYLVQGLFLPMFSDSCIAPALDFDEPL